MLFRKHLHFVYLVFTQDIKYHLPLYFKLKGLSGLKKSNMELKTLFAGRNLHNATNTVLTLHL